MHEVVYMSDRTGTVVKITVPWDEQSDLIPPPKIEFYDSYTKQQLVFLYQAH
jgi:hypothetical protein